MHFVGSDVRAGIRPVQGQGAHQTSGSLAKADLEPIGEFRDSWAERPFGDIGDHSLDCRARCVGIEVDGDLDHSRFPDRFAVGGDLMGVALHYRLDREQSKPHATDKSICPDAYRQQRDKGCERDADSSGFIVIGRTNRMGGEAVWHSMREIDLAEISVDAGFTYRDFQIPLVVDLSAQADSEAQMIFSIRYNCNCRS